MEPSGALRAGLAGFANGAASPGNRFRLRRFRSWSHTGAPGERPLLAGVDGRIPVEQPAATVTGQQLALAELVPGLRANAHAAAGALLIFGAGDGGAAAGRGDAIETRQPVAIILKLEKHSDAISIPFKTLNFTLDLLLARVYADADAVELGGQQFHFSAGLGERGLLGLSALQALVLIVFQALGLRRGELNFVFDRSRLRRSSDGVELNPEARGFLAVRVDLALQAGAQGVFATERRRSLGRLAFDSCERGLPLGDFSRQRAQFLVAPGSVVFNQLELYEVFNQRLHR